MLPEPSQATPPLHHLHAKTRWLHRIKEDAPHVVPSLLSSPPRAANGQLHSGHVYNWTSWLDDYGFGKCPDVKKCNVFPDGKPFPQSNDWRRKSYVYVWHTMGGGGLGPLQVLLFAKAAKMTLCVCHPRWSQASTTRRATAPPPASPSTPPTSHWGRRSWR